MFVIIFVNVVVVVAVTVTVFAKCDNDLPAVAVATLVIFSCLLFEKRFDDDLIAILIFIVAVVVPRLDTEIGTTGTTLRRKFIFGRRSHRKSGVALRYYMGTVWIMDCVD